MKTPLPKVEKKEPTTVPVVSEVEKPQAQVAADKTPAAPTIPFTPGLEKPKGNEVVSSSSESLVSLTSHVEKDTRPPNEVAINRQAEKDKARDKGGSRPGVPRGPYKKGKVGPNGPGGKSEAVNVHEVRADDEKYKRCYQAGVETVEALVQTGAQVFGNEWAWRPPQVIDLPNGSKAKISEQERGHEVFGRGFAANGWEGPSPTMTMFIFSLGFLASRLQQPETKKKVLSLWDKVKLWNEARKMKKQRGQIQAAPKPEEKPKEGEKKNG